MVVDGHNGKILHSRNGDAKRYPASLTKIMTLYLLFDRMEAGKLKETSRLRVSKTAAKQPPSKLGLKPGQYITVRSAIRALVTKSANDVAVVVAEGIGGTEANFARMMTEKARSIGMKRTVFKNASGLPNKHQVTTARDMITMANRLMFEHPEYYKHFSRKYFKYGKRNYRNHNRLLFDYKGTDGIKTGYIRASGFNLLANARRGDKHLIAVVFGGKTSARRNAAVRALMNKNWKKASRMKKKPRPVARPKANVPVASAPKLPARKPIASEQPRFVTASAGTVAAIPRPAPQPIISDGDEFHIQVGAYARKTDAVDRLHAISRKASDVVSGHQPLTIPVNQPQRRLYRARFAGFTRKAADSTCSQLKKRAITCVVMAAN